MLAIPLWTAGTARAGHVAPLHGDKTTREILFMPLPTAMKYCAKPFADVAVDPSPSSRCRAADGSRVSGSLVAAQLISLVVAASDADGDAGAPRLLGASGAA
jgi:hypothetical protein